MTEHLKVPIGELVGSPDTWNPARVDGATSFTYIDLTAVDQASKVIAAPRQVLAREAPSRARQVVDRRDVLVSTVRPNLNAVAVVPTSLDKAIASTGFCVLRPNPSKLDSSYLFHWVKTPDFVAHMVRRATGASYPAVSDRIVRSSEIPLPPLPEQRRIANILDQADVLRAQRRRTLSGLDSLAQSIFLDMFGNPVTNPMEWRVRRLSDIATTSSGGTPDRGNHALYRGSIPWVKSGELVGDTISTTEETLAPDGLRLSSAKLMPKGTVLVAMYGATAGQVSILGIEAATNQAICGIQTGPNLRSEYLVVLLRLIMPSFLDRRVGGAQPNLSQGMIRAILLPLPPLSQQEDFSDRLRQVQRLGRVVGCSIAYLDDLFASLQHRAFRGEL